MVGPAGAGHRNENNGLGWQTDRKRFVAFQGFPGRLANLGTVDPPAKRSPVEAATSNRANSQNTQLPHNAAERRPSQGDVGNRLRALARDVRRIGDAYRRDPESIAVEKDEIATELLSLARRLDGGRP